MTEPVKGARPMSRAAKSVLRPLALRNVGAMASGFLIILLLNFLTPVDFFRVRYSLLFSAGIGFQITVLGLAIFMVTIPGVFILRFLFRPVEPLLSALAREQELPQDQALAAKRRLLNLPLLAAGLDAMVWLVAAGAMLILTAVSPLKADAKGISFFVFRGLMVGMVAASIAFFLIESYVRRNLSPMVFGDSELSSLSGVARIPILRRIQLLHAAGTAVPLFILLGTLLLTLWDIEGVQVQAHTYAREVFIFCLALAVVFVGISVRLNMLVGKSITKPVDGMLKVVQSVKQGDFSQRIKVYSVDELGRLAEAMNDMIQGLAEREKIREAFGKYVDPEIRDEILAGRITLDGERREASVLFADLRGFTPFVEENPPEEVIASMRSYFTTMHRVIRRHGGLVLQFVGDEIEAVFGVPLATGDHATRALRAAIAMRAALRELNQERDQGNKPSLRHGVGVHTGPVLAGNSGSLDQLSYGLIGSTVNVASRIQGLTKELGHDILASQETVSRLDTPAATEPQAPRLVKGYSRQVVVHKVFGLD